MLKLYLERDRYKEQYNSLYKDYQQFADDHVNIKVRLFKDSFSFFHKLISEEWIPKHFQQKRGGGGFT